MRTFINNKYNFIYSKFNYQNAFCNICNYKNDLNINSHGLKMNILIIMIWESSISPNFILQSFISPENYLP